MCHKKAGQVEHSYLKYALEVGNQDTVGLKLRNNSPLQEIVYLLWFDSLIPDAVQKFNYQRYLRTVIQGLHKGDDDITCLISCLRESPWCASWWGHC